jgi:hypothetical protein
LDASLTLSTTAETGATGVATAAGVVVSWPKTTAAKRKEAAMTNFIILTKKIGFYIKFRKYKNCMFYFLIKLRLFYKDLFLSLSYRLWFVVLVSWWLCSIVFDCM